MSYYDDASLVLIPSGVKAAKVYSQKPTNGSGDLAFIRTGDTATRVNSAGLIEKVRTNLVTYSNTFSTTWTNINTTETSGQAGYDGTTNAWLISATGGSAGIIQNISQSGMVTQSVYAKAGTSNWLMLRLTDGTNNNLTYVDLTNRVFGNTGTNFVRGTITDVGGGWSRVSVTINQASYNSVYFYIAKGNNDLSTTNETLFIQNAQLETGDIATDYIATTSAAVSVGPVANVPRLDYLSSTCPRLLLEPQRTNILLFSEQFNNGAWSLDGDGVGQSLTANFATSPDGYQNADRLQLNKTGGIFSRIRQSATGANTYTFSVYMKSNTGVSQNVGLRLDTTGTNNVVTTTWQRFTLTATVGTPQAQILLFDSIVGNDEIADILIWGAQLEVGSYATSYIPTLGAAVTRGADACSKTGISSLIGQTEGTMFIEVENNPSAYLFSPPNNVIFASINSGDYLNNFHFTTDNASVYVYCNAIGGTLQAAIGSTLPTTATLKMAVTYTSSAIKFFLNGVLVGTDTSFTLPSGMSRIDVGFMGGQLDSQRMRGRTNQFLLFKTALTDAQSIELTTL